VIKVTIDFPLPDSDCLGEFPGSQLMFAQKIDDPLTNGPRLIQIRVLAHAMISGLNVSYYSTSLIMKNSMAPEYKSLSPVTNRFPISAPHAARSADFPLFPAIISPVNAPMIVPRIIPQGGKKKMPIIRPAIEPQRPAFEAPYHLAAPAGRM